jgi:hypothetical protein
MAERRAVRVRPDVPTEVAFVGTDERFGAPLVAFSPFGLSVQTSRAVNKGTIYRLGIRVGADYFRAAAAVRARIPGGFAVEFLSMTPPDRETLRRLYLRLQLAARNAPPS